MREDDIHTAITTLRRSTSRRRETRMLVSARVKRDPFRMLVSAMLDLHIKDPFEAATASERLLALAGTPQAMMQLTPQQVQDAIGTVDFYRAKAHRILQVCRILVNRYNGRVPGDREALMSLPGIGPKTASLILILAFNKPGICVDMNVHRIANRWGYVTTKSPEKTEAVLRAKLPRDYWHEISDDLKMLGDLYCRPRWPKCLSCPVKDYCDRVGVVRSR